MTARILVSRASRSLAYGALAVVLAQALASRGLSALGIGLLISTALVSGAAFSAFSGVLVRTFGARVTLGASGAMMLLAGVLLSMNQPAIVLACLLGVVSPGGQDVGPFAAIEHVALATAPALVRRLSWYNFVGAAALAFGALIAAVVPFAGVLLLYGASGAVVAFVAWTLPEVRFDGVPALPRSTRFGVVERLAALFALDAFAGGFVVQAFVAYWFSLRFGVGPEAYDLALLATFRNAAADGYSADAAGS